MARMIFDTENEIYSRDDMYAIFSYGVLLGAKGSYDDYISEFTSRIDHMLLSRSAPLTIEAIEDAVCAVTRVDKSFISYHDKGARGRELVRARHLICWFAYLYAGIQVYEIRDHILYKDHSSVVLAVQAVNNYIETDASYRALVDSVKLHLYNRGYALSRHHKHNEAYDVTIITQ